MLYGGNYIYIQEVHCQIYCNRLAKLAHGNMGNNVVYSYKLSKLC